MLGGELGQLFDFVSNRLSPSEISASQYVTTDTMLQKCAGIKIYNESLPSSNVVSFNKDDILLSNIRPYLQKLWFATFSGGCSNDVLVLRAKDRSVTNSYFYASYLKRKKFFDWIMQDVNGSKMPRGNKVHILRYRVPFVSIAKQNEMASLIDEMEIKIREAENRLEILAGKTSEILSHYLN